VQTHWYRRPAWRALPLIPIALVFKAIVALRRTLYRADLFSVVRVAVPVIVIGNITLGGTGKTPLVIAIACFLRHQGYAPGIVSRGYLGKNKQPREVSPQDSALEVGDEALLLAQKSGAPVWIARDRPAAAKALLHAHPGCDVIISDDGLQHYALARDVEIAVVDGERRFGNGFMLPAGPLREPRTRLESVDAVVVNGKERLAEERLPRQFLMQLSGAVFRNVANPQMTASAGDFRGKRVHAIAGIGNPRRFFEHLRELGIDFSAQPFPDHHRFSPEDFRADVDAILMTEKDAVKCRSFARATWWALPIAATLSSDFFDFLTRKLDGLKTARHPGMSPLQGPSRL